MSGRHGSLLRCGAIGHIQPAIDGVLKNNQKARRSPKALAQLDGYKRGLVNSLTGNLQRCGFEKTAKVETLQEIIDEMGEGPGSGDDSAPAANGV
jgi:hypothetical protein